MRDLDRRGGVIPSFWPTISPLRSAPSDRCRVWRSVQGDGWERSDTGCGFKAVAWWRSGGRGGYQDGGRPRGRPAGCQATGRGLPGPRTKRAVTDLSVRCQLLTPGHRVPVPAQGDPARTGKPVAAEYQTATGTGLGATAMLRGSHAGPFPFLTPRRHVLARSRAPRPRPTPVPPPAPAPRTFQRTGVRRPMRSRARRRSQTRAARRWCASRWAHQPR